MELSLSLSFSFSNAVTDALGVDATIGATIGSFIELSLSYSLSNADIDVLGATFNVEPGIGGGVLEIGGGTAALFGLLGVIFLTIFVSSKSLPLSLSLLLSNANADDVPTAAAAATETAAETAFFSDLINSTRCVNFSFCVIFIEFLTTPSGSTISILLDEIGILIDRSFISLTASISPFSSPSISSSFSIGCLLRPLL